MNCILYSNYVKQLFHVCWYDLFPRPVSWADIIEPIYSYSLTPN